ncbi:nucleosome assembly protein 1-like 1-A [Eurosta solidaginis]|uniref:nucleosome assembly protein 1-like 1-A n=1 Tax=Eurosta solidaginis TaxID=178769 RepID=UPI003531290F
MDASADKNIEVDSCNESDEGGKDSENAKMIPFGCMGALFRRQFLQEMVKNLPAPIQNRVVALKNIQLEHLKLEAEFFEEVYKLERKYQEKYQPLFDRRKEIVTGHVEPSEQKPMWKSDDVEDTETSAEFQDMIKKIREIPENTKGIPNFWFTIFRNTELLGDMVQEHDEPVLKKLTDIKIKYDDEHSYTLEFYFDKNEYFSNEVLTKQYFLKAMVDEDNPFGFEGPEIYKCKGCTINWEKKMNLTIKTIRKKQKHKERGTVRNIVKQVPNDSFFNFFNPPEVPEDKDEMDEETQGILATDFEIGHFLRARIIPKAILYYTGDIIDDEDDDDGEYDDDGEDDDDADESDDEAVEKEKRIKSIDDCKNQ